MKKLISAIIILAMLLALCACHGEPQQALTDPTAAPTQAADTAAPTAEPTEAPTPEPTAAPEPVELSFEACAEIVARLPWGMGDDEVYIEPPDESEELVPQCFYVADGRVYVLDRWLYQSNGGMLVCDIETGARSRIDFKNTRFGVGTAFGVEGDRMITPYMIFDMETGTETALQPPPIREAGLECVRSLCCREGVWYLYLAEPWDIGSTHNEHPIVTEYALDEEGLLWQPVREYLRDGWDEIALIDGGIVLDNIRTDAHNEYAGCDCAGNHYVISEDSVKDDGSEYGRLRFTLSRITPDGRVDAYMELDTMSEEYHPTFYMHHNFQVDEDGAVWLMMLYYSEVVIYKINMK